MLKVLYDFDAEAGTELTVKEGEVLTILSKDAGDGWWNARLVFTFITPGIALVRASRTRTTRGYRGGRSTVDHL